MDISVTAFPEVISIITALLSLMIIGIGIYVAFLSIKALKIHIRKNS